jgi:hypothetical protein
MSNKLTVLAANGEVTIVLVEPDPAAGIPNSIVIHWPSEATMSDPQGFPEVASGLTRLFAEAATKLASIKARRRL